ncbi:MAG TPA: TonB-dependent receptor, partial [Chitinispirillaceae bacterium]|nr:TonB-dependent receptor [Chitinispirillaceae bacterium]
ALFERNVMKFKFIRLIIRALAIALAIFSVINAQKDTTQNNFTELKKMVVVGSKTERAIENLPASISVTDEADIQKNGAINIDETLEYEQGIYNKRSKGLMESMAGLTMRGFSGADQVLILLDGQPLNNGYVGRVQFNNIAVEDIKKIEIARGPFSSLYGGNAMGGVVNMTTRAPTKQSLRFRGGLNGGGNANLNHNLYVGYDDVFAEGKVGVAFSYSDKQDEGYVTGELFKNASKGKKGVMITGVTPTTDRYGKETFLIGENGINSAKNRSVSNRLWLNLNENHSIRSSLTAAWYSYYNSYGKSFLTDSLGRVRDTGYVYFSHKDTTYTFRMTPNNFLDGEGEQASLIYTLSYQGKISDYLTINTGAGVNSNYKNWYTSIGSSSSRNGGSGKISSTPNTKGNLDFQAEISNLIPMNTLLAGISFEATTSTTKEHNLLDWENPDDLDTIMYKSAGQSACGGVFINDEFTILKDFGILENLILNAGFRFDYWRTMNGMNRDYTNIKVNNKYDDQSKTSLSPRAGLTLNLDVSAQWKPTFWISGGKAFRPPTNYDLYRTWLGSTGTLTESNPGLKPETMTSIEAAMVHHFFKNRLEVSITGYRNVITDMIYTTTISDELKIQRKENLGKAQTDGMETGLNARPFQFLTLFTNYTWTDAKVKENSVNPESVGKRVTTVPEHTVNYGFQFEKGWITLRLGSRYVSKRYTADDNSDTVDGVFGSRDPFFITDLRVMFSLMKRVRFIFNADNLFNDRFYDYYRTPGRTLGGEMQVTF